MQRKSLESEMALAEYLGADLYVATILYLGERLTYPAKG
jgi:hypothetical protein